MLTMVSQNVSVVSSRCMRITVKKSQKSLLVISLRLSVSRKPRLVISVIRHTLSSSLSISRASYLCLCRAEVKSRSRKKWVSHLVNSLKKIHHSVSVLMVKLVKLSSQVWGELHLDIIVDRMRREFKVECNVGAPQVAYRETITQLVKDQEFQYKKQTGGRGQFGHVIITFEPITEDMRKANLKNTKEENKFIDEIKWGVIPREFIPGVEKRSRCFVCSRCHRWLPHGKCSSDSHIWFLPRCRLKWALIPYRCEPMFPWSFKESEAYPPEPIMKVEISTQKNTWVMFSVTSMQNEVRSMKWLIVVWQKSSLRLFHFQRCLLLYFSPIYVPGSCDIRNGILSLLSSTSEYHRKNPYWARCEIRRRWWIEFILFFRKLPLNVGVFLWFSIESLELKSLWKIFYNLSCIFFLTVLSSCEKKICRTTRVHGMENVH